MTRKRFIRLVMADGHQRNAANDLADQLIKSCGTWSSAFTRYQLIKGHLPDLRIAFDDFTRFAVEQISNAVSRLAAAFRTAALSMRPLAGQREANHDDPGD